MSGNQPPSKEKQKEAAAKDAVDDEVLSVDDYVQPVLTYLDLLWAIGSTGLPAVGWSVTDRPFGKARDKDDFHIPVPSEKTGAGLTTLRSELYMVACAMSEAYQRRNPRTDLTWGEFIADSSGYLIEHGEAENTAALCAAIRRLGTYLGPTGDFALSHNGKRRRGNVIILPSTTLGKSSIS